MKPAYEGSAPGGRVFDCFLFSDELLLLEFRLRLLDPVVDRFVIVEADRTFQGRAKPFIFLENRLRFAQWEEKIIHVPVADLPDTDALWAREQHQRRAILRGLREASPNDIVVISDVDEIPNPEAIRNLRREPPTTHVALDMQFLNFCVDLAAPQEWSRAKACLAKDLLDPELLRNTPPPEPVLWAAGWHLSWLMPEVTAVSKLESYSHTENNREPLKSANHIRRCRRLGVGLTGEYLLSPVAWDEVAEPLRALVRVEPSLRHGPPTTGQALLARCYLLNMWSTKYLPFWLVDGHPIVAFLLAASLRAVTYPAALARRWWWRQRGWPSS